MQPRGSICHRCQTLIDHTLFDDFVCVLKLRLDVTSGQLPGKSYIGTQFRVR